MQIQTASREDMRSIDELYREAIAFQRHGGHPFWENFDATVVNTDIDLGYLYKLTSDRQIVGIFSFCAHSFLDEELWRGKNPQSARYINRIIVGRPWRGQNLFALIMAWCQQEVMKLSLDLIRLDTWAANPTLIRYYSKFGFQLVGERTTSNDPILPPQYRGLRLALMEKQVLNEGHAYR